MEKQAYYIQLAVARAFCSDFADYEVLAILLYRSGVSPHPKDIIELNKQQVAVFEKYEAKINEYYKKEIAIFKNGKTKKQKR